MGVPLNQAQLQDLLVVVVQRPPQGFPFCERKRSLRRLGVAG
jgi:hypothetical protein